MSSENLTTSFQTALIFFVVLGPLVFLVARRVRGLFKAMTRLRDQIDGAEDI